MEVRNRKVRITLFYLIFLSVVIGVVSILLYTLINREITGGNSPIIDAIDRLPFMSDSEKIKGIRVAILHSEQSGDYIARTMEEFETGDPEEAREAYLELAPFWQSQLQRMRLETALISDEDLLTELDNFNLLVLPAAYALSEAQITAIKGFLARRRGVIMTHITGNKDQYGVDRSWTLTEDVTGGRLLPMHAAKIEETDRMQRNLYFASGYPLSAQIPPAYPLPVSTFDFPVRVQLLEDRAKVVAGWEDPGAIPPLDLEENAGALIGNYRGGRFVWMGFTSHSVANVYDVWPNFYKIMENAVNWAGSRAIISKAPWPETEVAATIGIVNEQSLFNSETLVSRLNSHEFTPGLFFSNPNTAALPLGAEEFLSGIELAAQLSIERVDPEAPLSPMILERLDILKEAMQDEFDYEVSGFNSPVEINRRTESLGALNFDYIWLENKTGTAPSVARPVEKNRSLLFRRPPPPLVFIPQGARSDRTLIADTNPESPAELLDSMVQDYQRIENLGGLYSISLHPEILTSPNYESVIEPWLNHISDSPNWKTSPMDLVNWWRKYEGLLMTAEQEGRRVVLRISNEGGETIDRIRLYLFYPTATESITITAERIRTPIPTYIYESSKDRIEITLEDIDPGENRTYFFE